MDQAANRNKGPARWGLTLQQAQWPLLGCIAGVVGGALPHMGRATAASPTPVLFQAHGHNYTGTAVATGAAQIRNQCHLLPLWLHTRAAHPLQLLSCQSALLLNLSQHTVQGYTGPC